MKSKKTIRKMHHAPLGRALAKLQRSTHGIERRFDALVKLADEIEQEGRTLRRENAELRGRLCVAECALQEQAASDVTKAPASGGKAEEGLSDARQELWPELPNGEGTIPTGGEIDQRECEPDGDD